MTFREHTSKVLAAATVNGPEIITAAVRANDCNDPARRLEHLHEAQENCLDILRDINVAIAIELETTPTASPTIRRIREVARP